MKRILSFIALFCLLLCTPNCIVKAAGNDYSINGYKININVKQDNSYQIDEDINVKFNVKKHGIIRKIPTTNHIKEDGDTYTENATISDFEWDSPDTDVEENDDDKNYDEFKFGKKDEYADPLTDYRFNYTYKVDAPEKNYDEFYFNLIGSEWDTSIKNIAFSIKMPKKFDSNKLGFTYGPEGSSDSELVRYKINGTTITGTLGKTLSPGEALTVRLLLPKGYFAKSNNAPAAAKQPTSTATERMIFLLITGFSILLFLLFGKGKKVMPTITVRAPKEYNCVEMAYVLKGRLSKKDIVSLIIYLAQKGYIKIQEEKSKGLLLYKTFYTFEKIKEYDGSNDAEKKLMSRLFLFRTKVNPDDFDRNFVDLLNDIKSDEIQKYRYKFFKRQTIYVKRIITVLAVFVFLLTVFFCLFLNGLDEIGIVCLVAGVFIILHPAYPVLGLCIVVSILTFDIYTDSELMFLMLTGLSCSLIMFLLRTFCRKRTDLGNSFAEESLGLKEFLIDSDKSKIEELSKENSQFYYGMLPYAYVLGITKDWINKFSDEIIPAPDWYYYYPTSEEDDICFQNSFLNFIDNLKSSSSAGNSGSGGRGGSSGGGAGGGGGSAW